MLQNNADILLSIRDLTVDFKSGQSQVNALQHVSLDVYRGEILAIVGESGSGKSVTAMSILKLIPTPPAIYRKGSILFSQPDGSMVNLLSLDQQHMQEIRGNRIGMIFQEPMTSLNPVMRCGTQVMEVLLRHKKLSPADARKKVIEWFEKVKLPAPEAIFNRYPHELSGGQKQRVMIAMALCCEPQLLICDEPTTALDVTVQKTILELIRDLQKQLGMGVIFITHDLGVVAGIANRAVVLYKGAIVETAAIHDLFSHPKHPYTKALLACRPANQAKGQRLPVVNDFLGETQGTHTITPAAFTPSVSNTNELALEVRDLVVRFPKRRNWLGTATEYFNAVDHVSFDVKEGETLGLVGESGCGKTTLGRAILHLVQPYSGKILYHGKEFNSMHGEWRKDVQIVFQDPYSSLNPRITIGDAIMEPMLVHGLKKRKAARELAVDLLEKVNLQADHLGRYPHEFSGGQRQRIVIARALALSPSFLVCDESVSALDVSVQAQVLNLLNDLKKEYGFTIIFISHDLSVVRYISDRIMVMNKGRIEETGPADEVFYHPKKEYTKALIEAIPRLK